jgi:hypothetical protein
MTAGPSKPTLLIVGASARAAAQSAIRAGYQPWCADLFADSDLRAIVPDARRCPADQYPNGLANLIREAPEAPWIYTGGLENHPRLIGKMKHLRLLLGNGPVALRLCRNPFLVQEVLRREGSRHSASLPGSKSRLATAAGCASHFAGQPGRGLRSRTAEIAAGRERTTSSSSSTERRCRRYSSAPSEP